LIDNHPNIPPQNANPLKLAPAPLARSTAIEKRKVVDYKERGVKALIVDDDKYNLVIMSRYLEKLGILSATASDGDEAYKMYVSKGFGYFSFITMDIQMPITDGISSAKMIRNYEKMKGFVDKGIPIMFVSGNGRDDEKKECMSPNQSIKAIVYHRKPVSFNQMQETVQLILSRK